MKAGMGCINCGWPADAPAIAVASGVPPQPDSTSVQTTPPSDPIMDLINRASEVLHEQIGGSHYQRPGSTIQPIEFFHDNNIPFVEASIMKYVYRWRDKGGIEDLKKAIDNILKLIVMEAARKARLAAQ